jgi:hypothetical protein
MAGLLCSSPRAVTNAIFVRLGVGSSSGRLSNGHYLRKLLISREFGIWYTTDEPEPESIIGMGSRLGGIRCRLATS